jgi:LAO/AO transport system kinase
MSVVQASLALQPAPAGAWRPPVLKTEASTGAGVPAVWEAVQRFRARPAEARTRRLQVRYEVRLRELLSAQELEHLERDVLAAGELDALVARIARRELDPYTAASSVLARLRGHEHR